MEIKHVDMGQGKAMLHFSLDVLSINLVLLCSFSHFKRLTTAFFPFRNSSTFKSFEEKVENLKVNLISFLWKPLFYGRLRLGLLKEPKCGVQIPSLKILWQLDN